MMQKKSVELLIVAVPETAGSALYGMIDVLSAAGTLWPTLMREQPRVPVFRVRIVSPRKSPFRCGNGIPVVPEVSLAQRIDVDAVILPELWLGPDETVKGRHVGLMQWIRRMYRSGCALYSACSGSIFLAETGLLDGCDATSHWGYQDLFRSQYPKVRFRPEPNIVFAGRDGRIVTAGGTTSWHDLALHIIARYSTPAEALRIAKAYLMKLHPEGQLPYKPLVSSAPHADATVRRCERWVADHFAEAGVVSGAVAYSGIPERTLKRRFKRATGTTLIEYVQNLRIERAKQLLETRHVAVEEVSAAVGYEDPSFFRAIFRRLTNVTPAQYRRMFAIEKRGKVRASR